MRFAILLVFITTTVYSQQQDWNVQLLYHWNDTTLPLNYRDSRFNDCWGFVQDGREYAVIGSTIGTHFFDITNPLTTYQCDIIPGTEQGWWANHRDYFDYQGYLYGVCDEGASTLQIADLSYLPDSVMVVYDSDALIRKAHNLFIDTATAKLYALGPNGHAMSVYSLANPTNPTLLSHFDLQSYVHDAFVRNDTAYLHCGINGMYIYDFSNTSNPVMLGSYEFYPDKGYNHSGWLNNTGTIYAMADENYGLDIKILDLNDFGNIQLRSMVNSGVHDSSMAHNVFIRDGYLYVSYYNDGLQIWNVKDPDNPVRTGYYDTFWPSTQWDDYRGAWGVYPLMPSRVVVIADRNSGLYLFDVSAATFEEVEDSVVKEPSSIQDQYPPGKVVSVYPNPFTGNFKVTISAPAETVIIELQNLTGQLLRSSKMEGKEPNCYVINANELPPGVYLLKVKTGALTFTEKLIKSQ